MWKPIRAARGIVIVADTTSSWLIPWFYGCFRKHNAYPVHLLPLGLPESELRDIKQLGIEISTEQPILKGWWAKPQAIMGAGFERAVWLDLDCEVKGSIDFLFELPTMYLGMHIDHPAWGHFNRCDGYLQPDEVIYNSGVIAVAYGQHAIPLWHDACASLFAPGDQSTFTRRYGQYNLGDQEVLSRVIRAHKVPVYEITTRYNNIRLEPQNPDAVIVHHTGPGKEQIRKQILKQHDNRQVVL
jgi:hypothetical protein